MLAARLVRLIESHSDQLAAGLVDKFQNSAKCGDLRKVPEAELHDRAYEVYRNLSDCLLGKTEADIERRYLELGARRSAQGVAFSHFLWALMATKEHLFEYLQAEGLADTAPELWGELELVRMLDRFFDHAAYYAAVGYERAGAARAA